MIDACCFFSRRDWLTKGWSLLQGMANFPRDYLMPLHHIASRKMELRYGAAFAMQNRVLRTLALDIVPVFHSSSTRFRTPHSGLTFLPSATAALGFPKSERDFLGGWCAEASDRYARIAVRRITNMQRSVIGALQSQPSDPLAEDESVCDFDAFMESQSLDAAQRTLCLKSLNAVKLVTPLHGHQELTLRNPEELEDDIVMDDTEEAFHTVQPTSKRQQGNATERLRTAASGENPKEARAVIRSHLEPDHHVCLSAEKKIRTLHQLGKCYLLAGVDLLDCSYLGVTLPRSDCICRQCGRKGVKDGGDSSCTESSSSTSSNSQ